RRFRFHLIETRSRACCDLLAPIFPRHGRLYAGHPRLRKAWAEPGHDVEGLVQRERNALLDYSITSSARPSSVSGKVSPSALAVFMLMISSTLVACCTGRSAGLSPLRMRPV